MKAVLLSGFISLAAAAPGWERFINGLSNTDDFAYAVATDAQSNVIFGGGLRNRGYLSDFVAGKLDRETGTIQWLRAIRGTGSSFDSKVNDVAVDPAGDVVAAGEIDNSGRNLDFCVIKFSGSTGHTLWRRDVNGASNDFDRANTVAVDTKGDVIAGGTLINQLFNHFVVIKLDGLTGSVLWRREIAPSSVIRTQVNDLVLDIAGNVYAAGSIANAGTGEDFAVVKLDGATGRILWRRDLSRSGSPAVEEALSIRLDSAGNVVAGGSLFGASTLNDFAVMKLSWSSGATIWEQTVNGSGNFVDTVTAVAVDSRDDVIAVGRIQNRSANVPHVFYDDFSVLKFDGLTGAERWRNSIGGTGTNGASAVSIGPDDDPVAAGEIFFPATKSDCIVIRFDSSSGRSVWVRRRNGSQDWFDVCSALALDGVGDPIVAGSINRGATGTDLFVGKFQR